MRTVTLLLGAVATAVAGCAPSRAYLFDPVAQAVNDRTRITPEWRTGWQRSPDADARVRTLLTRPLTADSAALIAVLSSPELQAEYAELGILGGSLTQARTMSNPHIETELTFPFDTRETRVELTVVENVTDLFAMLPRVRAADANLRAARRRAVATTVDLSARARIAFYEAAAAEHTLALRRLISAAATASAELARSLFQAGNLPEFDLTRETVFEEEAQLAIVEAEADARAMREELSAVLGLSGAETTWRIAPELPPPPMDLAEAVPLDDEAITASLELEALRWNIEAAGETIGVARIESLLPVLGLGVAAQREDGWGIGPALTLSLPLFDWGQGRRGAAWARLLKMQHRYTAVAITLRAAARAAEARLRAAHQRAVRMRTRLLPLREKLLDQAVRHYNAMNLDAFELLVIRREQVSAEEQYIGALKSYWVAQTKVDQLRRGALPESHRQGSEGDHGIENAQGGEN